MVEKTLEDLILDLKQRRMVGDPPPVLLLGAGASVESGIGAMTDLFAFVNCADFPSFIDFIDPLTAAERFRLLARFLQTRRPSQVTAGYQALATLCSEAFFDLIFTTNLDPLLDDALANARLWRKDYLLVINGIYRADRLDLLLTAQSPRVKVVKLHGDLFHRVMAWTPGEMETYLDEIASRLKQALYGRDLLVVGHSLRDERIRELALDVTSRGGTVWFANPGAAPDYIKNQAGVRAVIGPDSTFEKIFPKMAVSLEVMQAPRTVALQTAAPSGMEKPAQSETMDDFMSSVVAVLGPGGVAAATAFVLAEPRVIVADAYPARSVVVGGRVKIAAGGQRLEAKVLRSDIPYQFGPLVLEAPAELAVAGLRLDTGPLRAGLKVSIGVAAGERTGLSSGTVKQARERTISNMPHLVELEASTAPGASGAPVVDEAFAVRGYVVAGSADPNQPVTYMYPSRRWAADLGKKPAAARK